MNSTTSTTRTSQTEAKPAAARRVLSLLQRLQHGTLHVQWPDGRITVGFVPQTFFDLLP